MLLEREYMIELYEELFHLLLHLAPFKVLLYNHNRAIEEGEKVGVQFPEASVFFTTGALLFQVGVKLANKNLKISIPPSLKEES